MPDLPEPAAAQNRSLHIDGRRAEADPPATDEVVIVSKQRVELGATRGAAGVTVKTADDAVVRVELADGLVIWSRADDLLKEHGAARSSRGAGAGDWTISAALAPARSDLDGQAGGQRGALGLAIKTLDFFGVDVSKHSAAQLGKLLEHKLLGKRAPGLYQLTSGAGAPQLQPVPKPAQQLPSDAPVLIFLHGTASSLNGSFGAIWADASTAGQLPPQSLIAAREARAALHERYGEHVYAFEHHSLSESPIANALALAKLLPTTGIDLHLVSHSRGGLVGELLCLAQRERGGRDVVGEALASDLFDSQRNALPMFGLAALTGGEAATLESGYAKDRNDLRELLTELDRAGPKISRFVRVACPARGTTLASGRLDRWLSVLAALAPPGFLSDITDFLFKVVKERTDPRTLPGLEAMMPSSPLTRLLRWPGLSTQADLSVISGDLEPQGSWARLKLLAVDWFYSSDHDLVVNTGSMVGGLERPSGGARFRFARGPLVNHFRYFSNPESLAWLISGLLRPDAGDGGFQPIGQAAHDEPRSRAAIRASRISSVDRPIAIVIPGVMGSALKVNGSAVWLNQRALFFGGLGDIAINASGIEAADPLDDFYGPLLEFLAASHEVHALSYDWRLSVRESARQLVAKLEQVLPSAESRQMPVRIVAHSMGGLVARAMLGEAAGRAVWKRIGALPGSRLLMLGTPNSGSHEAVRWMTGFNPTQAKLALLDITRGVNGVIEIIRHFPGLAELLPFGAAAGPHDYADPALWKALRKQLGAGFPPIEADALGPARSTWKLLADHPLPAGNASDAATPLVVYVAGQQPATVVDHVVVDDRWTAERKELRFIATPDGDGTVSWASGRLPGVPMYLARDTAHDDMCANADDPRLFRSYRELLETGRTEQLERLPSAAARGRAAAEDDLDRRFVLVEPPPPDFVPDDAVLRASGFGARAARRPGSVVKTPAFELQVTVHNRNLKYVAEPLLVGHYASSRLTGTEQVIDQLIGKTMSNSLAAGRYPQKPGDHQVFLNRRLDILLPGQLPRPRAVVVAGLGPEGQLRLNELALTVRQAVIAFAQRHLEDSDGSAADFELSTTLMGSGGLGMSTGTAAQAIAMGVQEANRRLATTASPVWPRVSHLRFVELYLDRATEAWHGLQVLGAADKSAFKLEPAVAIGTGAMRRSAQAGYRGARYDCFSALTVYDDAEFESPTELDESDDSGMPAPPPVARERRTAIAFTLDTRRARTEVRARQTQGPLLRSLILEASNDANHDPDLGRALFKLLIPAEIESFLGGDAGERATDLVIQLDDGSAGIPWELLDARTGDHPAGMPWAIRTRLLRRLQTVINTDVTPRDANAEDDILVVGEPHADARRYGPLPGARLEAEAVVRHLTSAGGLDRNRVHTCIAPANGRGPSARSVISTLLARDYRVLHIAGHGEPGADGGVVLSGRSVLGPREIKAMRRIPELVFLNCCHLARHADGKLLRPTCHNRVALAAGLAQSLIELGVRCVIAAGWAVEDEPAAAFATRFYQELLAGRRFIDAIGAARLHAWQQFPSSNTWAAYQCYGDADWSWRAQVGDAQHASAAADDIGEGIVSAPDLALRLENLTLAVRFGDKDAASVRPTVAALADRFAQSWGGMGAVADAFGTAFMACGAVDAAIDWFTRAVEAEDGSASLKAAEQLANAKARAAATLPAEQARVAIAEAIGMLERLHAVQPTLERVGLLGSASKRLAMVEIGGYLALRENRAADADPGPAVRALQQCIGHYGNAEQLARARNDQRLYYPTLNRIAGQICLALIEQAPLLPDDPTALDAVRAALQSRNQVDPDFWSVAGIAEVRMIEALGRGNLGGELPAALRALGDLHDRQPSPSQWATVRDQAIFVLQPYRHFRTGAEADAASQLIATLEGWCGA